jgi:hypothetical protein
MLLIKKILHTRFPLLMSCFIITLLPLFAAAQADSTGGQKDFDFEIGTWKTKLKLLKNPLSGAAAVWVDYEGTSIVKEVCNGKANLVELDVKGPSRRIEGVSLRLYNPETKQWTLNFASMRDGSLAIPATGSFKNNRGEFFNEDSFKDKKILVRFVISDITANSCHFEQAYSTDNGKTWEVNWIADDTRIKE